MDIFEAPRVRQTDTGAGVKTTAKQLRPNNAPDTTATDNTAKPKQEKTKVDLLWGAELKAILSTQTNDNYNNYLKSIVNNLGSQKDQLVEHMVDAYIREASRGNIPYKYINNGELISKKAKEISPRNEENTIKKSKEYASQKLHEQFDNILKMTPEDFLKSFLDKSKGYDVNHIETACQHWDINFSDKITRERATFFLTAVNDNTNGKYLNDLQALHKVFGEAIEKEENGGSSGDFVSIIQNLESKSKANYDAVVTSTKNILTTAQPKIDEQIKNVQAQLGAQANNKIKNSPDQKKNNQAVQNVIGVFAMYTFLAIISSVSMYETQAHTESWTRLNSEMIKLYNEGLSDAANAIKKIKYTQFQLGKPYLTMADALKDFDNIIRTILTKPELLNSTLETLKSQGLVNDAAIQKVINDKGLPKKIMPNSLQKAIADLNRNFTNDKVISAIVQDIYNKAGIKQTKAAKLGEKLGNAAKNVVNVLAAAAPKHKAGGNTDAVQTN
jgi:hypothetical protein